MSDLGWKYLTANDRDAILRGVRDGVAYGRSEEHTSELQSLRHLVCRLLLEKKKITNITNRHVEAAVQALLSVVHEWSACDQAAQHTGSVVERAVEGHGAVQLESDDRDGPAC